MMNRTYRSGWWCHCCTGPLETGRARENREARNEADQGRDDFNWWTAKDLRLPGYGPFDEDPWADVHLRWRYPWGEGRDEPVPAEWEQYAKWD